MRTVRGLRRLSPLFLAAGIALNAVLLFVTLSYTWCNDISRSKESTVEVGSPYSLIPPKILVTVEDTEKYAIYGAQANEEWVATSPASNGYLHVGGDHRFFALAFGHELHCMRTLRMAIAYPLHPDANAAHASHCLNYLRMYILCNPDLTLERFDPLEDDFSGNRFGATHVCRDWRVVYDELSRARDDWLVLNGTNVTG